MDRIYKKSLTALLFLAVAGVVSVQKAFAEEVLAGTNYDEAAEKEIEHVVKNRTYAGGQDEDDLKVQVELPKTVRKLGPTTEIPATPAGGDGF